MDELGEMVGVVTQKDALERAYKMGLDLVEVSPHADPPVCKLLDYGKFRFEEQKRRAEMRKKRKIIEIKEIQLFDNRYTQFNNIQGRELSHQDLGVAVLNRVKETLGDIAKVEQFPKLEGKRMIMVMGPVGK